MASRALDAVQRLVELAELRARAERVLSTEDGNPTFVVPSERRYVTGVRQLLDDELEEAWLRTVAALSDEGFPIEPLRRPAASTAPAEDDAAVAQAQADASGRRVRYGQSTAFPVRNARSASRRETTLAEKDRGDP